MDRTETIKILSVLKASYPRFYAGMGKQELENIVSLWNEMFEEPYAVVAAAVKALIASDSKGFPPVIGQVKEKIRFLNQPKEMTEAEAWNIVAKAVRNGFYGSREEFEKMPPVIQRIVGSPSQLKEWAMMDSETLHSVVSSNFQRSYKAITAREREIANLPSDVKKVVGLLGSSMCEPEGSLAGGNALPGPKYMTEAESIEKMEAERREYWAALEEQEEAKKRRKEEIIAVLRGEKYPSHD